MKQKKSSGWDGVPIGVIKSVGVEIAFVLADICNCSFSTGKFPKKAKLAIIKPLFKKGEKSEIGNYRPVSLLTCFSKIFEKAYLLRLNKFLRENNILSSDQHGFREGYSTKTAISCMVNEVSEAIEKKIFIGSILCDLSKAFDTINHRILLEKLRTYGVDGRAGDWIESYLTARSQRVAIETANGPVFSNWEEIKDGVIQGSILGPVLFSLYINDLPQYMTNQNTKTILFADDTSILVTGKSEEELNNNMTHAFMQKNEWFEPNKLKLNRDKTQKILFKGRAGKGDGTNGSILTNGVDHSTFLGVEIDTELNWKTHVRNVNKRVSVACYMLRMVANLINESTIKILYHAQVHSILAYGILAWGNAPESHKLFIKQKNAIRIMCKIRKRGTCRKAFKDLYILTLPCVFILEVILFVYDNPALFLKNEDIHGKNTRRKADLRSKNSKRLISRRNVLYLGASYFNNLPLRLKEPLASRTKFKQEVKNYLIIHCFYSTDEFLMLKDCKCKICI